MIKWIVLALALATSPAAAQQIITEYLTMLGPRDMRNSSGARLTDLCAIVQQDRANFHRFGVRDELDTFDAVFADPAMRAKMSGTCRVPGEFAYIPQSLRLGEPRYVYIRVFGGPGWIDEIVVVEGAG